MRTDLNRAMAWRETLVLSFLLACGFIQCNGDAHAQSGELMFEAKRYLCKEGTQNSYCIFQNVFIDNLNDAVLFGHADKQLNYQRRISFENSTIRSLPRSLVDAYKIVFRLDLRRLQIETIERDALKNGRHYMEIILRNNNIASLDAGVFDYLASLYTLEMDFNQFSSLPARLFQNTSYLVDLSMSFNDLERIEDDTFQNNPYLQSVKVANNRLVHFNLSLIPMLSYADVKNNQLQELNIAGGMIDLDASNNQIRNVVAQAGNKVAILELSHNKLNTTAWLKPFKEVRWLDLSFNDIEDITSTDFHQLTALNTLKLNNNRLSTFDISSSSSHSLRILDLSHNNLVNVASDLNQFLEMEELYLDHNSIVTVNLKTHRKLSKLHLSHNDWDCAKLSSLFGRLPATTEVDYYTERQCNQNYTLVQGICCKLSESEHGVSDYVAQTSTTEKHEKSPPFEENRYVCKECTENYDCIFRHVFIDNLTKGLPFGHYNLQWNSQTKLSFVNSTIRSLPRSLLVAYANVELLNLERLQIETIKPYTLENGRYIKELYLSYNNIASLDAGVFDHLYSLEILAMDGNKLSSLPTLLFRYTRNLTVLSMEGNKLQRIEDNTFHNKPYLESVNVANNRLVHIDLSLIPSLYDADVKHNLLQELKITGGMASLDASNNQIRNVVAQAGNKVIVLNLSHNKLNTTDWVKSFKKLQSLDLSFNEIEDVTATDFQQLVKLNTLELNNNRLFTFTVQSPSSRSLKFLDLSHNKLVNVVTDFSQFQKMEKLYLDHNSLVTVNLETLRKLSKLTLSHNDWDCAKLTSLSNSLPPMTVVDTETHCKQGNTLVRGICCTVSDEPYHDRLIKYMAEVSVNERINRMNARCSGDKVYDTLKNVSNAIASFGPPPSPTLAKEVEDLKTKVRHLEQSIGQARNQTSRDANKIDELMRIYYIPKFGLEQPSENLRKVFNHLKDRDTFRANETISRESQSKYKEKEVKDIESQINLIAHELNVKRDKYSETRKQIATKTHEVKKLQAQKNRKAQARRYSYVVR